MNTFDRALWQARFVHLAVRLGPAGLVGLVLIVLSIGVLAVGPPTLRQHTDRLEAAVANAQQQLARRRELASHPAISEDPATALWQQVPSVDEAPAFMGSTYQVAGRLGLQIERAEYRWAPVVGGRVQRYQVVLPVRGTYAALRPWLEEVLHQNRNVVLDELSVRREAEGAGGVEARVVLSFYGKARS